MSRDNPTPSSSEFDAVRRIDSLCDQYEADARTGKGTRIEELLAQVPPHDRRSLLTELLKVEREVLQRRGQRPNVAEYVSRFGEFIDVVTGVFGEPSPTGIDLPTKNLADATRPPSVGASSGVAGLSDDISDPAVAGRFRAVRPHAQGALGRIWVAMDAELKREVALKEILPEQAGHSERRERFVLEAEITGRLEHPGIVPVYGLGLAPDGRPFYAMRFIHGQSLEAALAAFHRPDHLDSPFSPAHSLELRKLLGRFVAVCNAIDFAHSRGIVHRDIKPANIMLGEYGETLVVDWGLAKVLQRLEPDSAADPAASASAAASQTLEDTVFGTPQYMSPEQAAGEIHRIGPASDVYSLGATFYHLLVGKTAFGTGSAARVLESVQRGEFPTPRRVSANIPQPLEAICLKAMSRQPEDRYVSARQLADDVEHWLADEPVIALRESWPARMGRFARRHRTWVQAATAALFLVAVISTVSVAVINEARQRAETSEALAIAARQTAERERQAAVAAKVEETKQRLAAQESERRARAATEFLVNTFKSADEVFGLSGTGFRRPEDLERPLSARDILVRGRQRVDEDLPNEPLLRATLLDSLSLAHMGLGDFELARPLFDEAYQIRTARLNAGHPDLLASRISLGTWKHIEGDFVAAENLFRDVLQAQLRLPDSDPLAVARTKFHLAFVLAEQFRHAQADKLFQECLAVRREKLGDKHRDVVLVRVVLAGNQFSLGGGEPQLADLLRMLEAAPPEVGPLLVTGMFRFNQIASHRARREYAAAIAAYQPLLADARKVLGTNHPINLAIQFDLAGLHQQNGDYLTAETLSRDALTRAARIIGSNPRLAEVHFKLAQLLRDRGDDDEAEFHFREAIRVGRRVANNPWAPRAASELAGWKFGLGQIQEAEKLYQEAGGAPIEVLLEMGRTNEAVTQAQARFDASWPLRTTWPHDVDSVYWTQVYGNCLRRCGNNPAARRIEEATLAFVRDLMPRFQFAPNASLRGELRRVASFLEEQSDLKSAEKLFRMSLEVERAVDAPRHPGLADGITPVAIFLREHGDIDEAIKLFEEALEIRRSRLGTEHLATTTTLLDLALARQKHGDGEEAIRLARDSHALRLRKFGAEDFRTLEAARILANILGKGQLSAESEKLLRESLTVYQRTLPATHSHIWQTVIELGDCLTAQQSLLAAATVYETALRDVANAWPENSWQRAEIASRLGGAYSGLKRFDDAETLLRTSLDALQAAWGSSNMRFRQALDRTVRHFKSIGNNEEVARLQSKFPDARLSTSP